MFKYVCVTEHRNSISPDVTVSHSLATSKGVCHHRKEVSSGCRVSDDVRGNRGRGSLTHTVISRSDAVMFSPELHQSSPNSSSPPVSILFVSQSCLDRCRGLQSSFMSPGFDPSVHHVPSPNGHCCPSVDSPVGLCVSLLCV